MSPPLPPLAQDAHRLAEDVAAACARIMPTWPLDRLIAVNPYAGWSDHPMAQAASELGVLSGARLLMPRAWYQAHWQSGLLQPQHLHAACAESGAGLSPADAVGVLHRPEPAVAALPLATDVCEGIAASGRVQAWRTIVTHQISQHCAAHFDQGQATWQAARSQGLLAGWRQQLAADRGLPWRTGRRHIERRLKSLPAGPLPLIAEALRALGVPAGGRQRYLTALLLSLNGWAAWCAYQAWQARLDATPGDAASADPDGLTVELLAIRLSWELLLLEDAPAGAVDPSWTQAWGGADGQVKALMDAQGLDWVWQRALEIAQTEPVLNALAGRVPGNGRPAEAAGRAVQAVFCIDVRSEVMRRALESVSPQVSTHGFAGFFGVAMDHTPLGGRLTQPQLPGLLAPRLHATEAAPDVGLGQRLAERRRQALALGQRWDAFKGSASSTFGFVEACGLAYAGALLRASLPSGRAASRWEGAGLDARSQNVLRPVLADVGPAEKVRMAHDILTAMGLRSSFAPLLLLAGHGSQSANNPQAAGLNCGACGGQTGEMNARVLAGLLNDPAVRQGLRTVGIDIPAQTHVIAGLHNTTTDEIGLCDTADAPATHHGAIEVLKGWLHAAGDRARAERAGSLGLGALARSPARLHRALRERANDWAQLRPEWGLAGNAFFVAAPRTRTQGTDLAGRAFLHDYDHRQDPEGAVLAQIMTAPMVVAHWINMQYHASTVDNGRYGSGNKTLHNVVGGHIGVFEGNGGDLRIGLPWQSLHDGQALRHMPVRLSAFIEAPTGAIDAVLAQHQGLRQLLDHGWLQLFQIDPEGSTIHRYAAANWSTVL